MHLFLLFLKVMGFGLAFCAMIGLICAIVCAVGVGLERLILGPRDSSSRDKHGL